jgi:hypothetical protein
MASAYRRNWKKLKKDKRGTKGVAATKSGWGDFAALGLAERKRRVVIG